MVLVGDKPSLLAADNQKLLVLSLEQADTDGQVQIHAPELTWQGYAPLRV